MSLNTVTILNQQRKIDNNCNVRFKCADNTIVYAHKLILQYQLEYINEIKDENEVIEITLLYNSNVTEIFIQYLYINDITSAQSFDIYIKIFNLAKYLKCKQSLIDNMHEKYIETFGLGKYTLEFAMLTQPNYNIYNLLVNELIHYLEMSGISIKKLIKQDYELNPLFAIVELLQKLANEYISKPSSYINLFVLNNQVSLYDTCDGKVRWLSIDEEGLILREKTKLNKIRHYSCEYQSIKNKSLPMGIYMCDKHKLKHILPTDRFYIKTKFKSLDKPIIIPSISSIKSSIELP